MTIEDVVITDSEIKCQKCGKPLTPEVYWYGSVAQFLWYCSGCRCGYVRDVYFTDEGAPSPFEDANLEGCPTDEESLLREMTDRKQVEQDAWYDARGLIPPRLRPLRGVK